MKLIYNINLNDYILKVIRKDNIILYALTGKAHLKGECLSTNKTRTVINNGVLKGTTVTVINGNKILNTHSIEENQSHIIPLRNGTNLQFIVKDNKLSCTVSNAISGTITKSMNIEL